MKLRIAGFERESVVDGPGIRFVIFAQGCPHHCPGCHNQTTWSFEGGEEHRIDSLLELVRENRLLKGVTFSGGEPFAQAEGFALLGEKIKEQGLDIVTYTGYTFEEILSLAEKEPGFRKLLEVSDYLVDGPYLEEERDLELPFRGSRNQRFIDVRASLKAGKIVEKDLR